MGRNRPKMSKISTFGSTFESYWINPSVTFTRKISKNFQFFVIFVRGQSSPDFWPMIKLLHVPLHPSRIVPVRRPIFPDQLKIFGPDRSNFSRKINDLGKVRSHSKCCGVQPRRSTLRWERQPKKSQLEIFSPRNFKNFRFFSLNLP